MKSIILGIIANLLTDLLRNLNALLSKKNRYLKNLELQLNRMPFIYLDYDTDILDDYVNIEAKQIDIITLSENQNSDLINYKTQLKEKNRVVILGNAGIGKTTYLRHTILKIIHRHSDLEFYNKNELKKIIPIYIPLKLLANSHPMPIKNYILKEIPLFNYHNGISKLLSYVRQGKIFLVLDGYDEISHATKKDYIKEELNLLMTTENHHTKLGIENNIFYQELKKCKVWLTSRKEYFNLNLFYNSFGNKQQKYVSSLSNLICIEIFGIGDNRYQLIRNIFVRYKQNKKVEYGDLLDEEYFIRMINKTDDEELINLSERPLFLTVICYIYITKVKEKRKYDINIANSYIELIIQCVNLLIIDIDTEKVRGFSSARKAAHLQRRNLFPKQKIEFLKYFSAQCYYQNISVFNYKTLVDLLLDFLEANIIESKEEIIESLKVKSESNFINQLLYCSIFTLVGKNNEVNIYDFPHRRFKEVLAALYFHENNLIDDILETIIINGYSELLYVYFRVSNYKDKIIYFILEKLKSKEKTSEFSSLVINCIETNIDTYNPQKILIRFIKDNIKNGTQFFIPVMLLKYIKDERDLISYLTIYAEKLLYSEKSNAFKLIISTLYHIGVNLQFLIEEKQRVTSIPERNFLILYEYLIRQDKTFVADLKMFSNNDSYILNKIIFIKAGDSLNIGDIEEFFYDEDVYQGNYFISEHLCGYYKYQNRLSGNYLNDFFSNYKQMEQMNLNTLNKMAIILNLYQQILLSSKDGNTFNLRNKILCKILGLKQDNFFIRYVKQGDIKRIDSDWIFRNDHHLPGKKRFFEAFMFKPVDLEKYKFYFEDFYIK